MTDEHPIDAKSTAMLLEGWSDVSHITSSLLRGDGLKAWLAEPLTPKASIRLTALFLMLSCLVSTFVLSARNIYDDEYSSLHYVSLSLPQVIHTANATDIHPPGMYVLMWNAYHLISSARWMNILPLLFLYAGLTIFCLNFAPLFHTKVSLLCFLLLATLHPQLFMWGNTIRWYSWWTGIALAAVVVALKSSAEDQKPFSYPRATSLALLLISLFYLNYITLLFLPALVVSMLLRYGRDVWKSVALTTVLFIVGIYPQIHTFLTVHVPNGSKQSAGFLLSSARLIQATLCSEAYLPWHPLAIGAFILFVSLLATGVLWSSKNIRLIRSATGQSSKTFAAVTLCALIFFCLVAASGLGIKPRNGLLLAPFLALPIALTVSSLRWQSQAASLILIALWISFGAEHLFLRKGLAKSTMINRPEEVTSYIRNAQSGRCDLIITYDPLLTFTVATSEHHGTILLTPREFPLSASPGPSPAQCDMVNLYLVRSSLNDIAAARQIAAEMNAVSSSLPNAKTLNFSFDPDAATKRRLGTLLGGSDVPDYRYVVTSAQVSPARLIEIKKELKHFAPAYGSSSPD